MNAEVGKTARGRLIANPSAGQAEGAQRLADVSTRLRTRIQALDIVITTGEGDAEDAAEDAARRGTRTCSRWVETARSTRWSMAHGVSRMP